MRANEGKERDGKSMRMADYGLPKTGLALVDAEGGGFRKGSPKKVLVEPHLVEAVPGLMHGSHELVEQIVAAVTNGHPSICGMKTNGKRVL